MNLYEICAELRALENAAEDGLYIDPETGELMDFATALEKLALDKRVKLENIAILYKNLASDAAAMKIEEENLSKRRKVIEGKMDSLKGYLMAALMREDGTCEKFASPRAAITIRRNAPSVAIHDEALLPREFVAEKTTVTVDRKSIAEALKRGIEVPGAHLEQSRSVMIK